MCVMKNCNYKKTEKIFAQKLFRRTLRILWSLSYLYRILASVVVISSIHKKKYAFKSVPLMPINFSFYDLGYFRQLLYGYKKNHAISFVINARVSVHTLQCYIARLRRFERFKFNYPFLTYSCSIHKIGKIVSLHQSPPSGFYHAFEDLYASSWFCG